MQDFLENTLPVIHSDLSKGTSVQLEKYYQQFSASAESVYQKMGEKLKKLESDNNQFVNSLQTTFKGIPGFHQDILKSSASQLAGFQDEYLSHIKTAFREINLESVSLSEKMKETVSHVQQCNDVFEGSFTHNLKQAGDNLKNLSEQSDTVKTVNTEIFDSLNEQAGAFDQVLGKRLNTFQAEIKQIDQLVDSFIEVTRKKILN